MSTSISVHKVTKVVIEDKESTGTTWTDFTIHTEDGERIEVTCFHEGPLNIEREYPDEVEQLNTDMQDAQHDIDIAVAEAGMTLGKVTLLKPGQVVWDKGNE